MKKTLTPVLSIALLICFFLSSCQKELSFALDEVNNETSTYSLDGGTGTCTGADITGTYTAGTAVGSANTVVLNIDVTTIGTYNITTATVNGVKFSASGSFSATGPQTVTLKASGTPVAEGPFSFNPGTGACSFSVSVEAATGGPVDPGPGNPDNYLRCKINGVAIKFNKGLIGYYVAPPGAGIPYSISIQGKNSDVSGSIEEFWVTASNPTAPTTGDYNNITFTTDPLVRGCQVAIYPTGFPNPGFSTSILNENTFLVTVLTVSSTSSTGTFEGTLYESGGLGTTTKTITEGEYKITF